MAAVLHRTPAHNKRGGHQRVMAAADIAYDAGASSPAENVDIATEQPLRHAGPAVGDLASTAGPAVLIFVTLALVLTLLWRAFFRSSDGKASRPRAALPAFDVEGGSSSGGSAKVLHPSIAQAAKVADVATLRQWMSDERCVVDAALAATGATALHAAAQHGHANVIRLLLDGGADALVVDAELRTPLHLVALAGHGLCVKALLDAGADPEGKDGKGASPLALAEQARHMGTARMMRLHLERRASGQNSLRRAK